MVRLAKAVVKTLLEYADMSRKELIQDLLRMRQHIQDELDKCKTCKVVINAEVEAGRRTRAARVDTKKSDIIELQKKGAYLPPGNRSRVVD